MGLREGGRGLRPHVRVLRHPVVPGQAAVPRRRSRSSPRSTRLEVAEIVLVAQDLASYGRDVGRKGAIVPLVEAVAARVRPGAAALPVPVRARRPAGRHHLRHRRPLLRPVAAARVQAAAAAHAALGRRRPVPPRGSPPSATGSPTPPSARRSSSATRARPRTTTTCCSRFLEDAQLDWAGFFAYSAGGRHLRRRPRRGGRRRRWWPSGCGSWRELQDRITAGRAARRWWARRSRCWSTSRAWAAATGRRPRSTVS